ncbi:MAG TPA: helix-turn-helix domain-containing protein [Pyrinomonadaceae bacterium]
MNCFLYTQYYRTLIFLLMSTDELSTAEVARRMNVSVHTVRWWCRHGLLPNAREVSESRGSVWKIPASDLKRFEPPKKTGRPPKPKDEDDPKARKKAREKAIARWEGEGGALLPKTSGTDGKVIVKPGKVAGKKYGTLASRTKTTQKLDKSVKQDADRKMAGQKKR